MKEKLINTIFSLGHAELYRSIEHKSNVDLAAFALGNKLFLLSKPFVIRHRDKYS